MKRAKRYGETLKYAFDAQHTPVLTVKPGEVFVLETEDAPSGLYRAQMMPRSYWSPGI